MEFNEEQYEDYEGEVEFGEDAEYEHDESAYDKAFEQSAEEETKPIAEVPGLKVDEAATDEEVEYEFDEVVGARDKKPIMSKLNQRVLDKYEMDDLLNQI